MGGTVVEERLDVLQEMASRACGGTASLPGRRVPPGEAPRSRSEDGGSGERAALAVLIAETELARLPALLPD